MNLYKACKKIPVSRALAENETVRATVISAGDSERQSERMALRSDTRPGKDDSHDSRVIYLSLRW